MPTATVCLCQRQARLEGQHDRSRKLSGPGKTCKGLYGLANPDPCPFRCLIDFRCLIERIIEKSRHGRYGERVASETRRRQPNHLRLPGTICVCQFAPDVGRRSVSNEPEDTEENTEKVRLQKVMLQKVRLQK